jgi:hypothetical protein
VKNREGGKRFSRQLAELDKRSPSIWVVKAFEGWEKICRNAGGTRQTKRIGGTLILGAKDVTIDDDDFVAVR